MKDKILIHTS